VAQRDRAAIDVDLCLVEAEILAALDPLLARYAGERQAGEYFGDFLVRSAVVRIPKHIPIELESTQLTSVDVTSTEVKS